MHNVLLALATATCLLGSSLPAATGDPVQVTALYWPEGSAGYSIEFSFVNNIPDQNIYMVLAYSPEIQAVLSPAGWTAYFDFRKATWRTHDEASTIHPGESRFGFVLSVPQVKAQYDWLAYSTGPSYWGTVTPVLIPEPASLLALATGLAGMGALWRRRK